MKKSKRGKNPIPRITPMQMAMAFHHYIYNHERSKQMGWNKLDEAAYWAARIGVFEFRKEGSVNQPRLLPFGEYIVPRKVISNLGKKGIVIHVTNSNSLAKIFESTDFRKIMEEILTRPKKKKEVKR